MEKQLEELLDKLESGEIEADDRLLSLLSEVEEEKKEEKKRKERKEEHSELINAIKEIKIDAPVIPEIQVPEITVPPIVIPEITVPPIEVTVPEITIPKIESPKVVMPDEIKVKKPTWLTPFPSLSPLVELLKSIKNGVLSFKLPTDAKNPISVRLSDGKEFYKAIQEAYKGIAAFRPIAAYRNALGNEENGLIDADRHVQVDVLSADSVEDKLQAIRDNQDTQINQLSDVTHTNEHTGSKEIRTYLDNHICATNTTTTPLGSNATFTGGWQDCLNYQEVNISILSDKNSATNGLVFQWSADGVNIGDTDVFSYYTASGGTNYTPNPAFRYFRVLYTNGAVAQTTFSLQTILRRSMTGGSFHRIDSTLKDDNDARLTITIPKLKTAQNTYVSQTATTAGNAKVSIEEIESNVVIPISTTPLATVYNGSKTVPTVTAETIGSQATTSVTIKALSTNTVAVYVGTTGVTTSTGFELLAGESVTLDVNNLSKIYVISGSSSQVVRYIAL